MADISKITLPSGDTYDIKDETARASGKVSGVKGNAESSYRTGDVNLTYPNLGTAPIANGGTGQTSAVEANWALENRGYTSDANTALSFGIYNTNTLTANLPALALSQNNGCGVLICYVSSASTHNNTNNWIWQIWFNTTTIDMYKRKKINAGSWTSWEADTDKAAKLTTARTLNVSGQATGTAQSFDGSANVSIPITAFNTQGLVRPRGLRGLGDVTLQALVNANRANHLAFLPPDQVIVEVTVDGGTTWTDGGVSDVYKTGIFSETRQGISLPRIDGKQNLLCGMRITFTGMKYNVPDGTPETEKYNYWNSTYVQSTERYCQLKDMYFWLSASNNSIGVTVQRATGANPNSWVTIFDDQTYYMTGWSGCDYLNFGQNTFGGGTNQTGNYWNYRLTFMTRGPNGSATEINDQTGAQSISEIRGYGDTWWTMPVNYGKFDHMYLWDVNQNVTFPKKVTATEFAGNATTATTASSVSNTGAGTVNAYRNVWFSDSANEKARSYDSDFQYNPSTNTLKVDAITGSAAKVNNHTVEVDVPSGAKFTDTTYSISMSGNRITLTPSSGTASYVDLPVYDGTVV